MHRPHASTGGVGRLGNTGAYPSLTLERGRAVWDLDTMQVEELSAQLDEAEQDRANRPGVAVDIHELERARRQARVLFMGNCIWWLAQIITSYLMHDVSSVCLAVTSYAMACDSRPHVSHAG